MKKLIIAASIVCAAAITHASTVIWGLNAPVDSTIYASGTAYLICVNDLAKPTLSAETAADWYAANSASLAGKAFRTGDVVDGAFNTSEDIFEFAMRITPHDCESAYTLNFFQI